MGTLLITLMKRNECMKRGDQRGGLVKPSAHTRARNKREWETQRGAKERKRRIRPHTHSNAEVRVIEVKVLDKVHGHAVDHTHKEERVHEEGHKRG